MRNEDHKKFELEKKEMEEKSKTDKDFLQREIDEAHERLRKMKEGDLDLTLENIDDEDINTFGRRKFADPTNEAPPNKRQRLSITSAPTCIDEYVKLKYTFIPK